MMLVCDLINNILKGDNFYYTELSIDQIYKMRERFNCDIV
mgnify:CR=1 FL=1